MIQIYLARQYQYLIWQIICEKEWLSLKRSLTYCANNQ